MVHDIILNRDFIDYYDNQWTGIECNLDVFNKSLSKKGLPYISCTHGPGYKLPLLLQSNMHFELDENIGSEFHLTKLKYNELHKDGTLKLVSVQNAIMKNLGKLNRTFILFQRTSHERQSNIVRLMGIYRLKAHIPIEQIVLHRPDIDVSLWDGFYQLQLVVPSTYKGALSNAPWQEWINQHLKKHKINLPLSLHEQGQTKEFSIINNYSTSQHCSYDGHVFDSLTEYKIYKRLKEYNCDVQVKPISVSIPKDLIHKYKLQQRVYTPDFGVRNLWISDFECFEPQIYVEIKGKEPTQHEVRMVMVLSIILCMPCMIMYGDGTLEKTRCIIFQKCTGKIIWDNAFMCKDGHGLKIVHRDDPLMLK